MFVVSGEAVHLVIVKLVCTFGVKVLSYEDWQSKIHG